jgi:glycosyltransferase A (GT-A) superfamily protein (DUF2064 family)
MGYIKLRYCRQRSFDLKASIIETAFEKLVTHEVVIGPAEDGGYYLLGLKRNNPLIFQNKTGNRYCFKATMKD